jgi:hypothetical protein
LHASRFGDRDVLHEQAAEEQQAHDGERHPGQARAQRLQQREARDDGNLFQDR